MALAAKTWRSDITLLGYQNEAQAQNDFKQANVDGVYMTSMRARSYNNSRSVDAIGAVPSYAIAQKAISFALDKRNQRRLTSRIGNQVYEVVGIRKLVWLIFCVKDKNVNSIEQIKGKKFAVLAYDEAQKIVVKSLVDRRSFRIFRILPKNLTMAKPILWPRQLMPTSHWNYT